MFDRYASAMDFSVFLDVIRALECAEVEYILVGGVAVNLHGVVVPRRMSTS